MQVYIVVKDKDRLNRYDEPNRYYVDIDCVKATEDGAFQRMRELIIQGYCNADVIVKYLT